MLRVAILEAATQILEDTGLESSLTIRAVTRRAGIAAQSFYLQFASLSDLLYALYAVGFDHLRVELDAAVAEMANPRTRLEALCAGYLTFAANHPGVYRNITGTIGMLHPEWNAQDLPGAAVVALLGDVLLQLRPQLAADQDALNIRTALLMTQLHGIAALMANRPTFPWPPTETMITRVVSAAA